MGGRHHQQPARVPSKVGDFVARELANAIVRDSVAPGSILPSDSELAQRYGVGRASVREALRILESLGVLRLKTGPGGGPIVTATDGRTFARVATLFFQLQGATVEDVLQARIALEPIISRLAAANPDQSKRELLSQVVEQLEAGAKHDLPSAQVSHGLDFHHVLASLSANPVLELHSEALNEVIRLISPFEPRYDYDKVRSEHLQIADAVARGDLEAAAEADRRHMVAVRDFLVQTQPELLTRRIAWS